MWNRGVLTKGLRTHVCQACFPYPRVTCGAAIGDALLGKPDLLHTRLEVLLQRGTIGTRFEKPAVLPLVMPPLVEVVLGGCNRKRDQQQQTDGAEGTRTVAEEHSSQAIECAICAAHLSFSTGEPMTILGRGKTCQLRSARSVRRETKS